MENQVMTEQEKTMDKDQQVGQNTTGNSQDQIFGEWQDWFTNF